MIHYLPLQPLNVGHRHPSGHGWEDSTHNTQSIISIKMGINSLGGTITKQYLVSAQHPSTQEGGEQTKLSGRRKMVKFLHHPFVTSAHNQLDSCYGHARCQSPPLSTQHMIVFHSRSITQQRLYVRINVVWNARPSIHWRRVHVHTNNVYRIYSGAAWTFYTAMATLIQYNSVVYTMKTCLIWALYFSVWSV